MKAFESKNEIKASILREAAREWGFKGMTDIDLNAFDPLVDLMIGACASEVEKLSHDLANSRNRVFERLVDVLTPDTLSTARPAHTIMRAMPVEATHLTSTHDQFFIKSIDHKKDMFFAPLDKYKLVDAHIDYIAFDNKLFQVNQHLEKDLFAESHYGQHISSGSYFIGIKVNSYIRYLQDLTFFFDWKNEPRLRDFLQYMHTSTWHIGEQNLQTTVGHNQDDLSLGESQDILSAMGFGQLIAKNVGAVCHPHFITISNDDIPISSILSKYPSDFNHLFEASILNAMAEDLVWIEIKTPPAICNHLIHMECALNCFPIVNRKLVEKQDKLDDQIHIIPLELLDEHFAGIDQVTNSAQVPFSEIAVNDIHDADFGMYALRTRGVKRFDHREAQIKLDDLLGQIYDETVAFKGLAYATFSSDFNDLEQVFNRIKKNIPSNFKNDSTFFLFAKPFLNDNMIYIKYWTSDGEKANNLPQGTPIKLHYNSDYIANTCIQVTASRGGKGPLSSAENIHQFKGAVLNRGKVVTSEDIKKYCIAEFGTQNIQSMTVEKGLFLDKTTQRGLIQCIHVYVTKHPTSQLRPGEITILCQDIENKLAQISIGMYPIRISECIEATV